MLFLQTWSSKQSPWALTAVRLHVLTAAGQLTGLCSQEGEGRKESVCLGWGREISGVARGVLGRCWVP